MALSLRVIKGRGAGQCYVVSQERTIIGRGKSADITLDVLGASREHVELKLENGLLTACDLGSRNGTKLNDEALEGSRTLKAGDRLAIGTSELLCCDDRNQGKARLQVVAGEAVGQEYAIDKATLSIGRGTQADLKISDKASSRINTIIAQNKHGWDVEDQNSSNGTLLNGEKIDSKTGLRSGDMIQVGQTVLEFIDGRIEDLAGSVVGKVSLVRRVGSGSLGVVYEGKQHGTGEMVAIKIIDPSLNGNAQEKGRILNGGRAAARMDHDNVAPVIDSGSDGELTYVVSAWAENGSLEDLIGDDENDLPPPMVVTAIALDAARGLQAAHEKGVYHQGLRPGNLLLFRDGVCRVSDFGTTYRYTPKQSKGGVFPYYVSPEELAGQGSEGKANQFSLGAVLYHALTGQPPFADDSAEAVGSARLTNNLPAIQDFNQAVPLPLADIVATCLALDANDRYADWDALINDLEQVIAHGDSAKVQTRASSVMAGSASSSVPRRAGGVKRGRGARGAQPSMASQRSSNNNNNMLVGAVIGGAALLLIVGFAMSGGGGGYTAPTTTSSSSSSSMRDNHSSRSSDSSYNLPERYTANTSNNGTASTPTNAAAAPSRTPDVNAPPAAATSRPEPIATQPTASTPQPQPSQPAPAVVNEPAQPEPTPVAKVTPTQPEPTIPATPAAPTPTPEPARAPEPEPVAQTQDGLPVRSGELINFATNEWQKGSLTLTDGSEQQGEFKFAGDTFTLRRGEELLAYNEASVAAVNFIRPNEPKLRLGDNYFSKKEFDKSIELYEEAREKYADHPYFKTAITRATSTKQRLDTAMSNINNGQLDGKGELVIDGLLTYIAIMEPRRLDKGLAAAWENAWRMVAGKVEASQRTAWQQKAKSVGVALHYDEQAPVYLADAVAAAKAAGSDPKSVVKLFEKAIEAMAYLDDEANFLLAKAYHGTGKGEVAGNYINKLSDSWLAKPEVEQLAMSLGLKPPKIQAELIMSTYIGGSGNQAINEVGFSGGNVFAKGKGYEFAFNLSNNKGTISGNIAEDLGDAKYGTQPHHPKSVQTLKDPRNGQTYSITTKQVHGILQAPYFNSSAGWKMWSWGYKEVNPGSNGIRWGPLMADSRGYDVWLMPDGMIGVKCWTDGGNSVLTRNPFDMKKNNPIENMNPFKSSPGGMGTLFMLVDPNESDPKVMGGTFMNNHVTHQVVDRWGRVYVPVGVRTENYKFGSTAGRGGLFVLDPKLTRTEANFRFGGSGSEVMGRIALRDNILVLGGRTNSKDLVTKNAAQGKPGGGFDGWVAVIRLWPKN